MVTLIITGRRVPVSSKTDSMANRAALQLSVSKIVSTSSASTPPATRARICSV